MADDESKKTDNSNKQVEKAVNTPQKETRKREADIDLLEGSSTGKRAKRVSEESPGRKNAKILLSQQEDGHCPQCGSFASNWSVHCRTNHREFVDYGGDFVVAHRHEVYQFISQCLQKLGASEHHSSVLAKYLTFCDTFGYSSEGLQKLNYYVDMLIADKFSAFGEPQVLEETGYSFKIDCSGILGPLAADFCASKALSFDIGKEPKAVMGIVNAEFSSEFPCVPELMDFCADSLYRSTKNVSDKRP
ncbi:unnamed protein product [Meloidogyne enterolobii]|uniref:Uncharacterized protein n=1 Tax=Meloidogyne enterolobii TaxID=390850 RepID=A0ACB0ZR58_MELEN